MYLHEYFQEQLEQFFKRHDGEKQRHQRQKGRDREMEEGQEVDVKVIDINTQDRKVALSMKALLHEGEGDYREYLRNQGGGRATLGDLMKHKK